MSNKQAIMYQIAKYSAARIGVYTAKNTEDADAMTEKAKEILLKISDLLDE